MQVNKKNFFLFIFELIYNCLHILLHITEIDGFYWKQFYNVKCGVFMLVKNVITTYYVKIAIIEGIAMENIVLTVELKYVTRKLYTQNNVDTG